MGYKSLVQTGGCKLLTGDMSRADIYRLLCDIIYNDELTMSVRDNFSWFLKQAAQEIDRDMCGLINKQHNKEIVKTAEECANKIGVTNKVTVDVSPFMVAGCYCCVIAMGNLSDVQRTKINDEIKKISDKLAQQTNIKNKLLEIDPAMRTILNRNEDSVKIGKMSNLLINCKGMPSDSIKYLERTLGPDKFKFDSDLFSALNGIILTNISDGPSCNEGLAQSERGPLHDKKYARFMCELKPELGYGVPINSNPLKVHSLSSAHFADPSGPPPRGARLAVILHSRTDNKYYALVCNHFQRGLVFPGGGMELNETPEQTALRETLEETGYVVPPDVKLRQVNVMLFPYHPSIGEDLVEPNAINILLTCLVEVDSVPSDLRTDDKEEDILGSQFVACDDLLKLPTVNISGKSVNIGRFGDNLKKCMEIIGCSMS